jgi:CzcA family heavy metal efflux pump
MINSILEWSIRERFIVVVLSLSLVIAGLIVSFQSDVDVLPDFAPPQVSVRTEAPGLAPEEVEALVSLPIESVLNGIPGVKLVRSVSMTGISNVIVIFDFGRDIYLCRQLVNEKLPIVAASMPKGVGAPTMLPVMPVVSDILKIALISKSTSLMDLRAIADWDIRNRLLAVPGVARVFVMGGDQKEFQVLVHPDKLRAYGVTLNEVRLATEGSNTAASGGFLMSPEQQIPVRGISRIRNLSDLANSVVATRNGAPILLKHIASVQIGPAFKIGEAVVNGQRAIELIIGKQPGVNTLQVTQSLEKAVDSIRPGLPKDVELVYAFRLSDFIEKSINNVLSAVELGGVIVVFVLLVFLMNWRTSVISLTAIPLSLLAAVLAIRVTGGSINTMTLGGLAIAVGEVVDDAIVDVENVYRRLRENRASSSPQPSWSVILNACREVRSSVVYATLIVALVFVPVFLLQGLEGRIFGPLGFSYVAATLSSLVVALTVTPALCMYFLGQVKNIPENEPFVVAHIKSAYKVVLDFSMRKPGVVVVTATALLAGSVMLVPFMGQEFLPKFREDSLIVSITGLPGQSLELGTNMAIAVQKRLLQNHDVLGTGQRLGRAELDEDNGGPNFSELDIKLKESSRPLEQMIDDVRKEVESLPGVVVDVGSFISNRIDEVISGGTRTEIAIKIFGPDLLTLQNLANQVRKAVEEVPGSADVRTETQSFMPEVTVTIDRERAARYGLTGLDLSSTLETAYNGKVTSQVLERQRMFPLKVWFDEDSRRNVDALKSLLIDTPVGSRIPLSEIATIEQIEGPSAIIRENVARRIAVLATTSNRDVVSVVVDAQKVISKEVSLPPGYYIVYGGQYEAQQQASRSLFFTSLFSLVVILLLLRQGLSSWRATLLVATNLPLACIGGLFAVAATGNVLSIGSLVGFISLFGISTRNSLMLVGRIHTLLEEANSLEEAIRQGALERVTPVLMTALTAAFGMLPLAVLGGTGRELEQPLAVVIVGGMISSTALTLAVIPALFKIFMKSKSNGPGVSEAIRRVAQ